MQKKSKEKQEPESPAAVETSADILAEAADLPLEQTIEERLLEAENKIAELQDAYLRARAEAENIQRRSQEEIVKAHKFAIEGFAESILAVKDSLETTLKVEKLSVDAMQEGVTATLRQLTSVFEKNKLFEIAPEMGEKLDPMIHQAISTTPSDQEPNTVVMVLQKGYTLSDRLLRPALVIVAAGQT